MLESGPDNSCTPACFQTRCVWPNADQAILIGSRSVLHNMIHAFFEKTELNRMRKVGSAYTTRPDSGCTLAVMGISGHNLNASGSDQACLLGQYHPPCNTVSLPSTVLYNQLPSTVHYNQPTIHRALQSAYLPPCTKISLSPTVQYNQPTIHRALQSAYHPPCTKISLSPTVQYNQPTIHTLPTDCTALWALG